MPSNNLATLIHYMSGNGDFLEFVQSEFADYLKTSQCDAIYLYQLSVDGQSVQVIAQATKEAALEKKIGAQIARSDAPFLTDNVSTWNQSQLPFLKAGEELLVAPIYMNNNIAMHVVCTRQGAAFSEKEQQDVSELALILQCVAQNSNIRNSIEISYKFLETVVDKIEIGVAALTPDCTNFLLMNQVLEENEGAQKAMYGAIFEYKANGEKNHAERFEDVSGRWYDVRFQDVTWIDGSPALACTTIDVTQKVKNQQRIEYQANNDYLTGLFNRMKCERDLAAVIKQSIELQQRGVVLFLDLDNFKQVNDGLGHQYGDVLLQEIANGIMSIPQISNHCYRMGGDEFVIVIPPEIFGDITQIVDQISAMFNEPWNLMDVEYYCTMSMGLAIFPDHASDVQQIIKKADYAMYEAKKGGKNRYLWYTPDDPAKKQKEEFEESIRTMVGAECKDFTLHYQPVFGGDGKLIGAEALVRISSDQFGELLPAEFLPVAEYLGLMNRIGNHVLQSACEKLAFWTKKFSPDFLMFVNIASTQLLQSKAVEQILDIIEKSGALPENVVLDVSERIEFRDEEKALSTLEILHAHGVKTAMDDFGSGKQSITMLERMKASYVKFDHTFLGGSSDALIREGVIAAVAQMTQALDGKIGFVGIETEEQLAYAKAHGGECLEGYYFGEPLPDDAFEERWWNHN